MVAYVVGQLEILDRAAYQPYMDGFGPCFERHGGELLATSLQKTELLEGQWATARTVIMRFPDRQAARDWFDDPEYQELARIRRANARTNLVIVDGIDGSDLQEANEK